MTQNNEAPINRKTILVIDDEEVVRFLFQTLLEEEGFETVLAADGREGVEALNRHRPALVLVDKNLPDVSGVDLIASEKKRHPDTEFIMITGYASLDSAVKAMEVGAFSYLTKPFEEMDLVLDRIHAALEVNNLRVETSELRERLDLIDMDQKTETASGTRKSGSQQRLLDQVRQTISFLDTFINKRNQVPTPASWARTVDMIEQKTRLLKKSLEETGNS